MAMELQKQVTKLLIDILGAEIAATPEWLMRPGKLECGPEWERIRSIYCALTGLDLPGTMPARERRSVDAVLCIPRRAPFIFEFDERQHFNSFRAMTLTHYPDLPVAFDRDRWIAASNAKKKLEGGGFGKARPPLFDGEHGRHKQRAFRDALSDILPFVHGFAPTLRIADFEVKGWIFLADAKDRLAQLLASKPASR